MEQVYRIGIRREDKSVWERRTPLIPSTVKEILEKHPHIHIKVQPSKKRIFSDAEYLLAGAILDEDITDCSLILGIKEIPKGNLIADKTFVYFSHTIKVPLDQRRRKKATCSVWTPSWRRTSDSLTTRRSLTRGASD